MLRAHPAYGAVILRTHYAEDALADAVTRGVSQYVLVGSGMDSFALRRPSFARDLEIFEVDHPATQRFKTGRLKACGIPVPRGVHLVPADLSQTGIDAALEGSPFRPDIPSFFSWLGVTIYLTRTANLDTLGAIAACAASGSELVFDYVDQSRLETEPRDDRTGRARAQVAAMGEPWVSGFSTCIGYATNFATGTDREPRTRRPPRPLLRASLRRTGAKSRRIYRPRTNRLLTSDTPISDPANALTVPLSRPSGTLGETRAHRAIRQRPPSFNDVCAVGNGGLR